MAARARSNVDHTRLISKSIFVTNFPDNTTSKDLWEVCKGYGTVVDVFIPDRKSKAGKRFAFVRFIKVDNVDRLVGNLCTLWIGRMHLHANVARFDRPPIHSSRPNISTRPAANGASSFASVLKGVDDYSVGYDFVNGAEEIKSVDIRGSRLATDIRQARIAAGWNSYLGRHLGTNYKPESAYEAKKAKEMAMIEFKEMEFLTIDANSLPEPKASIIRSKQETIIAKYTQQ
ncbi:RNA-directed DNA polymerase, eukaryota, nucleotide-binding alpha-beta plait domain protein [Tanacetum coccineum]